MIFKENEIYIKSSKHSAQYLVDFLISQKKNPNTLDVLDYGCGPGTIHKFIKFKKVYLYDKNKISTLNFSNKFLIYKNFKLLTKSNKKFDLILINSVIQYINPNNVSVLLSFLDKKLKKNGIIFLGDVPKFNRVFELFFCINFKKIFHLIKYFLFKK